MYKGTLDCLAKTIQNEGYFAVYKGFIPVTLSFTPWAFLFWLCYERFREIAGVPRF